VLDFAVPDAKRATPGRWKALLLIDTAPIIYFLDGHRKFAPRFKSLFAAPAGICVLPSRPLPLPRC
jgi:hypothetical protein